MEDRERVDVTEKQKLKYITMKAIFEAIELSIKTGASLTTIEDLLCYARRMYCRGKEIDEEDHPMKFHWPKDWEQAKIFLSDSGYEDATEYFICLNATHKRPWNIMESAFEKCRYCGEAGAIKYYYLGLYGKVKLWTSDKDMCAKMTAHWSGKEHWLNGSVHGWEIKKEVWDGARFSEFSWFWNPDESWCLPARCIKQGSKKSSEEVLQAPAQRDGRRELLYCGGCCTRFLYQPVYVTGDPRNIAYINIGKYY